MDVRRGLVPFLISALLAAPVAASERDAMTETARGLYDAGKLAYAQQRWDDCRAKLLAAWAIKEHFQVAGLLSACELKLGRAREAAEHAAYGVGHDDHQDPALTKIMESELAEARTKIATVVVASNVQGSMIVVDGKTAGPAPLTAYLEPGHHSIDAQRDGYASRSAIGVDVTAGSSREVSIDLVKSGDAGGRRSVMPAVIGGGIAALGVGVGIGGLVGSTNASSSIDMLSKKLGAEGKAACRIPANATSCTDLRSAYTNQGSFRTLGIVGFAVGGAALIGTVIYLALPAKADAPVQSAVSFGSEGARFTIQGSF